MAEKRLHVAFMAIPAYGHVNPSLALVSELAARGHRVTYAIGAEFAQQVTEAGATAMPYTTTFPSLSIPEAGAAAEPEPKTGSGNIMMMFLHELTAVLPQVRTAYANDVPDVIVHDIGAWHGPILAEGWGVPAVQLSPTYVAGKGMAEVFGWNSLPGLAEVQAELARYVAELNVSITADDIQLRPRRCIVAIPRAFQPDGHRVSGGHSFVGPMLTRPEHFDEWTPPDGRPVLLIALGSAYTNQPDFFRTCLRAFADLDWQVVMAVGRHVDPTALGPVPANIDVRRWVPQPRVLSSADAFVTHAGMGSVMEALCHEVPMIAVPLAADQMRTGSRIAELGLGRCISRAEATAEALREALFAVTSDQTIVDNLQRMRAEILACGGASRAADIVESEVKAQP